MNSRRVRGSDSPTVSWPLSFSTYPTIAKDHPGWSHKSKAVLQQLASTEAACFQQDRVQRASHLSTTSLFRWNVQPWLDSDTLQLSLPAPFSLSQDRLLTAKDAPGHSFTLFAKLWSHRTIAVPHLALNYPWLQKSSWTSSSVSKKFWSRGEGDEIIWISNLQWFAFSKATDWQIFNNMYVFC